MLHLLIYKALQHVPGSRNQASAAAGKLSLTGCGATLQVLHNVGCMQLLDAKLRRGDCA